MARNWHRTRAMIATTNTNRPSDLHPHPVALPALPVQKPTNASANANACVEPMDSFANITHPDSENVSHPVFDEQPQGGMSLRRSHKSSQVAKTKNLPSPLLAEQMLRRRIETVARENPKILSHGVGGAEVIFGKDGNGLSPEMRTALLVGFADLGGLSDAIDTMVENTGVDASSDIGERLTHLLAQDLFVRKARTPLQQSFATPLNVLALGLDNIVSNEMAAAIVVSVLEVAEDPGRCLRKIGLDENLAAVLLAQGRDEAIATLQKSADETSKKLATTALRIKGGEMKIFDIAPEITRTALDVADIGLDAADYPFSDAKNAAQEALANGISGHERKGEKILLEMGGRVASIAAGGGMLVNAAISLCFALPQWDEANTLESLSASGLGNKSRVTAARAQAGLIVVQAVVMSAVGKVASEALTEDLFPETLKVASGLADNGAQHMWWNGLSEMALNRALGLVGVKIGVEEVAPSLLGLAIDGFADQTQ
ncbi:MAG: hypothetical protein A2289_09325 [Deltaproteobacteria bacterium RIFOXYA12_FULL_58_15]|nr:MAG: hypothetical protein A2289_09325 [Deltaproteobacteria bacterium RIFOXYA12_FULL_58_15]